MNKSKTQTLSSRVGIDTGPGTYSEEAADTCLRHISEWAKWMSAIQTAAIGGLGAIILQENAISPGSTESKLAFAAISLLAFALLFSAWILSAVASISMRLGFKSNSAIERAPSRFHVYSYPSFTWFPGNRVPLGWLMVFQHCFWALGLCCLAAFFFVHLF